MPNWTAKHTELLKKVVEEEEGDGVDLDEPETIAELFAEHFGESNRFSSLKIREKVTALRRDNVLPKQARSERRGAGTRNPNVLVPKHVTLSPPTAKKMRDSILKSFATTEKSGLRRKEAEDEEEDPMAEGGRYDLPPPTQRYKRASEVLGDDADMWTPAILDLRRPKRAANSSGHMKTLLFNANGHGSLAILVRGHVGEASYLGGRDGGSEVELVTHHRVEKVSAPSGRGDRVATYVAGLLHSNPEESRTSRTTIRLPSPYDHQKGGGMSKGTTHAGEWQYTAFVVPLSDVIDHAPWTEALNPLDLNDERGGKWIV